MSCRIDWADLGQQSPGHHLIDTFFPEDTSSLQKTGGTCGHASAENRITGRNGCWHAWTSSDGSKNITKACITSNRPCIACSQTEAINITITNHSDLSCFPENWKISEFVELWGFDAFPNLNDPFFVVQEQQVGKNSIRRSKVCMSSEIFIYCP